MRTHDERHRSERAGWLRAAVLGANDGIISVSGLVVGVAAAGQGAASILLTGFAGLVAGATSMAAGEYVSVRTQADTQEADIAVEKRELAEEPERELAELAAIYRERGVEPQLADEIARQLTRNDALGAHARDELGITDVSIARPLQAALASAGAFTAGALVPIATAALAPAKSVGPTCAVVALLMLAILGGVAAWAGGASPVRGAVRVTGWGALAMGLTWMVGQYFGGAG